ncbi:MAG: hypothetical protein ACRDYD_00910 [Acidimicrobiales bacterium]
MTATEMGVGDPARRLAGLAVVASLAVAGAYGLLTVLAKETPALYLHQPWQDDPYDALVSFDFVALPLLVVTGVLRVQLCRRYQPLPARRMADLLRVCALATGLSVVTEGAEWIAVASGTHGAAWGAATAWQVAVLAAFTAATSAAGVSLRRGRHALARSARLAEQPDWLADATTLGLQAALVLGPVGRLVQWAVCRVDRQVIPRVRSHPIVAAALAAAVLTAPEVVAKVVLEGYPAPLVLLVFTVSAGSLFAFLVVVGSYLRVVAPKRAQPSVWLCAAIVACLSGTLAVAFRDSLLWTLGTTQSHETIGTLAELVLGAGALAGALSLVGQSTARQLRQRSQQA